MNSSSLTTLANLKADLKLTTTTDDQKLERLIDAASSWIETQTNRKLKARRYNGLTGGAATLGAHDETKVPDEDYLFFSGSTWDRGGETIYDDKIGKGIYQLPQWPVQANSVLPFGLHVLTVRDANGETWDDDSLVEWRDYVVEREKGRILLNGPFVSGYRNYRVTMAAGYQTGDNDPFVPSDLEQLCIELCRDTFRGTANLQSESIGTWSRTFNTQLSKPFVKDTLDKYSRISL